MIILVYLLRLCDPAVYERMDNFQKNSNDRNKLKRESYDNMGVMLWIYKHY